MTRLTIPLLISILAMTPMIGSAQGLPNVVSASVPFYPQVPRHGHIDGTVRLRVFTDGARVSRVQVESGPPTLAQAAQENVNTWLFDAHSRTSFEVAFRYKLLPTTCDATCKRCESAERPSILLKLPREVVVTAEEAVVCDPSAQKKQPAGAAADQSRTVTELVASLGPETRLEDIKELRGGGRDAVRLLVATLQPIPEVKILPQDRNAHHAALHVIWAIRALRYLTGKDFRAPTTHRFGPGDDERTREQLLKKEGKTLTFFATWMSRDSVYIAPADAQRKIIEAWRRWFSEQDENWRPIAEPSINDWYFDSRPSFEAAR